MGNGGCTNISNSLRKYRKARGLKQKEVAQILKLKSTGMISRWEKGLCLPSTLNIFRLAVIYRTMVDSLYFDMLSGLKEELKLRETAILGKSKGR
jgi:transcriptional regulator with XRE-family HTH domain